MQRRAPCLRELRHHGGERRPLQVVRRDALRVQKRQHLHAQLVGRMALVRGHAPHVGEHLTLVDPHDGLGVPHIDGK